MTDDLLPPYDSLYDANDDYEDYYYPDNSIKLFNSNGIKISYVPGQWNDSGIDPPAYSISIKNPDQSGYGSNSTHWLSIEFDHVWVQTINNNIIKYDVSLNLTDFVKVISSPFSLDLKDGQMGKFYEDDFDEKDIVLEVDRDFIISKIEKLTMLKAFL